MNHLSHGRHQPRPQRAPCGALSDVAARVSNTAHVSDPFRIGPATPGTAARWHERGIAQDQAGHLDAAIESYHLALLVGGPDAQIAFDLASALAEAGQVGRAIERYLQVLEFDARRQDAWVNLGDLLLKEGQTQAGIEALRHAVRLDTSDAAAHYNLADALDQCDDKAAAWHWGEFLRLADGPRRHLEFAKERMKMRMRLQGAASSASRSV